MTRMIVIGLLSAAALYAYRAFKAESQRVPVRVRSQNGARKKSANGTLVQDPKTGQYYVERH